MASLFGHIAASTVLGVAFFPKQMRPAVLIVAGFCAFAPDLDVLAFRFDVSYGSIWGHRGWTHSLFFAIIFGWLMAWLFFRKNTDFQKIALLFILSVMSHPMLDMLTDGGRGCALWWPLSEERVFFPFRPIAVSPMSVSDFFGEWGLAVLASEVIWIGFPCILLVLMARLVSVRN